MGVSGIQSNYAETPYGDIRNTEQAVACAIWCLPGSMGFGKFYQEYNDLYSVKFGCCGVEI